MSDINGDSECHLSVVRGSVFCFFLNKQVLDSELSQLLVAFNFVLALVSHCSV